MTDCIFFQHGNIVRTADKSVLEPPAHSKTLPPGVYSLGADIKGFYLEQVAPFSLPEKTYGNTKELASRIMNTFGDRKGIGTGIFLTGLKGTGKTLLSKEISVMGLAAGIPTILINQPYCGEEFNKYVQSITQPVIFLFDEYEKVYRENEHQEKLLTLLDGTYPSHKLFVITTNSTQNVSALMFNRPGRVFYLKNFDALDRSVIEEYCEDHLTRKEHIPAVVRVAYMFSDFNMDMLKALVEEMNRYDESPAKAVQLLNMSPNENGIMFSVTLFDKEGKNLRDEGRLIDQGNRVDPMTTSSQAFSVLARSITADDTDETEHKIPVHRVTFGRDDFMSENEKTGELIFRNRDGYEARFLPQLKRAVHAVKKEALTRNLDAVGDFTRADAGAETPSTSNVVQLG